MRTIGLVGSGNVAWNFAHSLLATSLQVSWIWGRNSSALESLHRATHIPIFTTFPDRAVDLILICVKDDAITDIIQQIPPSCKIAYTSGTVSLQELNFSGTHCGVFYPLQSFSKERIIELAQVPFLIESSNKAFENDLFLLAQKISKAVFIMDSKQRLHVHIAAVFANNFVNHLIHLSESYLRGKQIDPTIIRPLLQETIEKALVFDPYKGQSGPARRKDKKTIEKHLDQLDTKLSEIYKILTKSIVETYSPKTNPNDQL